MAWVSYNQNSTFEVNEKQCRKEIVFVIENLSQISQDFILVVLYLHPDSNYTMTVSLYADAGGQTRVWQGVYPVSGSGQPSKSAGSATNPSTLFNLQLGSGNYPLPSGDALNHPLWIGVAIDGAAELRPLTPVAASAYALTVADSAITSSKMGTDYVSSVQINEQV